MADKGRTLIGTLDLKRPGIRIGYTMIVIFLIIVAVATLFSLLWVLISSVKSSAEIFRVPPTIWPRQFDWSTYTDVWNKFF